MNCNPALHTNCEVLKEVIPSTVVETLGELMLLFTVNSVLGQKLSHMISACAWYSRSSLSECVISQADLCDTAQHVFICCHSFILFSRFNSGDLQQVSPQAEDSSSGQSEGVCAAVQWSLSSWFGAGLQQEQHEQWMRPEKHQRDWTQKM